MKSPEQTDNDSDEIIDEYVPNHKKNIYINKSDKKKKINKSENSADAQIIIQIPFEEQEIIELVLMDFKNLKDLDSFKNMKSLTLIQQNINSLKIFSNCNFDIRLEFLSLNENTIESLDYIDRFINLKELQLNFNLIKKIDHLDKLEKLEKLWLCENQIKSIENIPKKLTNFWVAFNLIEKLDEFSFSKMENLTELNISANFLSSFNDINILSDIESLKVLNLSDPNFGENPICMVNNYRLYIFHKIPNLTILDEIYINKEEISENRSTINKKKIYYKNRIKQMNRVSKSCIKMLKNFNFFYKILKLIQIKNLKSRIKLLEYYKYELIIKQKFLENESNKEICNITNEADLLKENEFENADYKNNLLFSSIYNGKFDKFKRINDKETKDGFAINNNFYEYPSDEEINKEISNEIKLINSKINKAIENMNRCDNNYKEIKSFIEEINDFSIVSNFFELESFGNIKIETGVISDKWASSCIDLIKNRLSPTFCSENNIKNINILRIWKITNKMNRILYDNNYDCLIEQNDKFGDEMKYYDYVFLYTKSQNLEEITQKIFENFQNSPENDSTDENNFFIFTTHLDKSEPVKIFKSNSSKNQKLYTVICKCIILENLVHKSTKNFTDDIQLNSYGSFEEIIEISKSHDFESSKPILEISNINKDKKIYVMRNRHLFIPEYIIEYNYIYNNGKKSGKISTLNEKNLKRLTENIIISSYNPLREGKFCELNSEFLKNFNSCVKSLINSEIQGIINKNTISKNSICTFQFFDEIENTDLFFAKNSIYSFINHCFKFMTKESFHLEFGRIKENLLSIKNTVIKNPFLNAINNDSILKNINSSQEITMNAIKYEEIKHFETDTENLFKESMKNRIEKKKKNDKSQNKISVSEATQVSDIIKLKIDVNTNLLEKMNLVNLNLFNSNINDESFNNIIGSLAEFKSIKMLNISYNLIKKIDFIDIIILFKDLKFFDISHNNLRTINSKKFLNSDTKINFTGKMENLDISFNNLFDFSEILKIMKCSLNKNSNFFSLLENLFCISFFGNPINEKFFSYFSSHNINPLYFIINKQALEKVKNRILSIDEINYSFLNENFNFDYLENVEVFNFDMFDIIQDEIHEKLNLEENLKIDSIAKNNYLQNQTTIYDLMDSNCNLNSEILKYSLLENLNTFNLIYETYSFSKNYRNYNQFNMFTEKIEIEKSTRVLLLSKQKLRFIPVFKLSGNKQNNSKSGNSPKIIDLNKVKILYLNINKISTFSNLTQFSDLQELYLQSNKINSFPNFEIKTLKKLDLSNNRIKSLSGVNNLKNITNLLVENNSIKSLLLEELLQLADLKEFNISGNSIDSLKECIGLKNISSLQNLDLSGNGVSDFSDFRIFMIYYLGSLRVLNRFPVEKNEIIQSKEFFDGRITSELLENRLGHSQTRNIRELDLSNNKLKSFERIFNSENFPNLKKLDLSRNLFSSFKIFGNLPSLNTLYFNSNVFYSIIDPKEKTISTKGLLGIINLEVLEICDNNLTELNGIQILKNLKILILRKNNISKIDNIDGLVSLVFLDISFNKLRALERNNIGILPNLKTLLCDGNFLKNINALSKLQSLNFISLENNKIIDTCNIEKLAYLENLIELNISNNPISKNAAYRGNILRKFVYLCKLDKLDINKEERENAFIEQANQSSFLNNDVNLPIFNSPNLTKIDLKKMGMRVNFINLDINSSQALMSHIRQNSFEENQNRLNFRSQSLSQQFLYDNYQNPVSLPIINALSINGNVQNNEKNQINNYIEEYENSPSHKVKKSINFQMSQLNKTNKNSNHKQKFNGTIPLRSLLKQLGEAISQNQNNNNIANLISKIPNNGVNKNTSTKFTKK